MSEITFNVTIDYTHHYKDGVIDPESMETNLEAAIEHGRQDSWLTPNEISANWVHVTLAAGTKRPKSEPL